VLSGWNHKRAFISITVVFVCSRFLFWVAGIKFYSSFAHRMWQLLDLEWLRLHLAESILYLHSQPPLFNVLTGGIVKLFPQHYYLVFRFFMLSLSWISSLILYDTMRRVNISTLVSFVISLFFLLNPALILYENLYSYTLLTVFLVTALPWALLRFERDRTLVNGCIFLSVVAALCLTRSSFHLIWFLLVIPFVWKIVSFSIHFRIAFAVSFIVVLSWYLKNLIIFDSFTSSSWLGMNVARLVTPPTDLGAIGPFKPASEYRNFSPTENRWPHVVALACETKQKGYVNFNHYRYLEISEQFKADAIGVVRQHPELYLSGVGNAFVSYFNPSTHAPFVDKNFREMRWYAKAMTLDFTSWRRYDRSEISATSGLPAFLLYGVTLALILIRWRSWFNDPPTRLLVSFSLFMVTYGMLVGNLLEYGENNRFRFETHTCLMLLFALVIDRFLKKYRNSCLQNDSM
jgi:hypothetical protein